MAATQAPKRRRRDRMILIAVTAYAVALALWSLLGTPANPPATAAKLSPLARWNAAETIEGRPAFVDPQLAPALAAQGGRAGTGNPVIAGLERALENWSGNSRERRLIALNLERARALPPVLGERYILVNPAAGQLWLMEKGRETLSMRVLIGKQDMQTPTLFGLIRHAVFNPYWNVPPDLVRDRVAPKVLGRGRAYLDGEGLEALSDWSARPQVLDPDRVDWRAVAAGKTELRMRQRPGPRNMMGTVKFMSPNPLGIYLHDTPNKGLFSAADARASSGCVRLEDAPRLAQALMGRTTGAPGWADHEIALKQPIPIYIVYLTAYPEGGQIRFTDDPYARDRL